VYPGIFFLFVTICFLPPSVLPRSVVHSHMSARAYPPAHFPYTDVDVPSTSDVTPASFTPVAGTALQVIEDVSLPGNDVVSLELPKLTSDEDMFCLAVVEYGGNLKDAYKATFGNDVGNPAARARVLMTRPEIVLRVRELMTSVSEGALISLGSHLVELADIRDLAKATGQLKTALSAEEARGRVAGFYVGKEGSAPKGGGGNTTIMVSVTTKHDASI
jgi:hypothetical protein